MKLNLLSAISLLCLHAQYHSLALLSLNASIINNIGVNPDHVTCRFLEYVGFAFWNLYVIALSKQSSVLMYCLLQCTRQNAMKSILKSIFPLLLWFKSSLDSSIIAFRTPPVPLLTDRFIHSSLGLLIISQIHSMFPHNIDHETPPIHDKCQGYWNSQSIQKVGIVRVWH